MKHAYFKVLLLATSIFFLSVNAQSKERLTYGLNLDIGAHYLRTVNRAKPGSIGPDFTQKPAMNFGIGGFIRKPLGKNFNLESGIGYSFNRVKFSFDLSSSMRIRFHYVEIPLLINYNVRLSEKSSFIFSSGAKLKILAAMTERWYVPLQDINTGSFRDRYRSLNFTYVARASYNFQLTPKHKAEIGFQFCQDLNSIMTNEAMYRTYNYWLSSNIVKAKFTDFGISIKYFL